MKKLLFILLLLTAFNCNHSFAQFQNDDILTINSPREVRAGSSFQITFTIQKNQYCGNVRLQIEIPQGFTASATHNDNSQFKFEDQRAIFQWSNLPSVQENDIKVSLQISSDTAILGYSIFRPSVVAITNGESIRSDFTAHAIMITEPEKSAFEIKKSNAKTKYSFDEIQKEGICCIRQVPFDKNGEIIVNLLVSKGASTNYGKVQEKIPYGYIATNIDSKNGIFVFNQTQNLVKYMWMNLPSDEQFIISYKLTPTDNVRKEQAFVIQGAFYYTENNQTKNVNIQERRIELTQE